VLTIAELKALDKKPIKVETPKVEVPKVEVPKPKVPEIDFGYKGKFNDYVKDIRDEAKIIIDKLPKPEILRHVSSGAKYNKSKKEILSTTNKKTFLHEYGHYIDNTIKTKGKVFSFLSQERLLDAYNKDGMIYGEKVIKKSYDRQLQKTVKIDSFDVSNDKIKEIVNELYDYGDRKGKNGYEHKGYTLKNEADANLSDIFDALFMGRLQGRGGLTRYGVYGHGEDYYIMGNDAHLLEPMANMFELWANVENWERTKKYFPNMTKEFENIMKEILDGEFE